MISGFDSIKNIKEKFSNFKGVIYNIEEFQEVKNISETKKYITSLGIKLKVGKPVNDIELAKKLQANQDKMMKADKVLSKALDFDLFDDEDDKGEEEEEF